MTNRQQQQHISAQQLSEILEDSITSLLKSTPADPIAFLAAYFKHTQQPTSAINAYFQLSQVSHTADNFPDACFRVFSKYRDCILDQSGATRDRFLTELFAKICGDIPMEITKILTSKLQLTPPADFKSFERCIATCYTYNSYMNNSDSLYSLISADSNSVPQVSMLETLDQLKGEIVMLTQIADVDRVRLSACVQELVLRNAGEAVGRLEFVRMLALMFIQTIQ